MANGGLQSVGFFVGYIALSLIIVAVVLPFWKMNDLSNEVKNNDSFIMRIKSVRGKPSLPRRLSVIAVSSSSKTLKILLANGSTANICRTMVGMHLYHVKWWRVHMQHVPEIFHCTTNVSPRQPWHGNHFTFLWIAWCFNRYYRHGGKDA